MLNILNKQLGRRAEKRQFPPLTACFYFGKILPREGDLMYPTKNGIPSHRLVAEFYLGRPLRPEEVVHHINENKKDPRIENLIVFENNAYHMDYHKSRRPKNVSIHSQFYSGKFSKYQSELKPYNGIVLYGPSCKKKKEAILKMLAQKTKRELGTWINFSNYRSIKYMSNSGAGE